MNLLNILNRRDNDFVEGVNGSHTFYVFIFLRYALSGNVFQCYFDKINLQFQSRVCIKMFLLHNISQEYLGYLIIFRSSNF